MNLASSTKKAHLNGQKQLQSSTPFQDFRVFIFLLLPAETLVLNVFLINGIK